MKVAWKTPYTGIHPTMKKFFALTNSLKMSNTEIGKILDVSDGAVSSWRHDNSMPTDTNLEAIKAFIAEYKKDDEPEQTTIPETATLVDRQPPKDKRDGEVLTYRIDKPWVKERPKGNTVIHKLLEQFGEETITKAVLGTMTKDQLIEFIQNGGTK